MTAAVLSSSRPLLSALQSASMQGRNSICQTWPSPCIPKSVHAPLQLPMGLRTWTQTPCSPMTAPPMLPSCRLSSSQPPAAAAAAVTRCHPLSCPACRRSRPSSTPCPSRRPWALVSLLSHSMHNMRLTCHDRRRRSSFLSSSRTQVSALPRSTPPAADPGLCRLPLKLTSIWPFILLMQYAHCALPAHQYGLRLTVQPILGCTLCKGLRLAGASTMQM